jgi:hypothetical protein
VPNWIIFLLALKLNSGLSYLGKCVFYIFYKIIFDWCVFRFANGSQILSIMYNIFGAYLESTTSHNMYTFECISYRWKFLIHVSRAVAELHFLRCRPNQTKIYFVESVLCNVSYLHRYVCRVLHTYALHCTTQQYICAALLSPRLLNYIHNLWIWTAIYVQRHGPRGQFLKHEFVP